MINSIEQLYKHQGFARGSKISYFIFRNLIDKMSKEEIMAEAVDKHKLFHQRSFKSAWNIYEKLKDDVQYHKQYERKSQ